MMSTESNSEKSVSYQKKDGHSHDKDLKVCFLVAFQNGSLGVFQKMLGNGALPSKVAPFWLPWGTKRELEIYA